MDRSRGKKTPNYRCVTKVQDATTTDASLSSDTVDLKQNKILNSFTHARRILLAVVLRRRADVVATSTLLPTDKELFSCFSIILLLGSSIREFSLRLCL